MYDVCTLYVVAQPGDNLKKKKVVLGKQQRDTHVQGLNALKTGQCLGLVGHYFYGRCHTWEPETGKLKKAGYHIFSAKVVAN